MEEAWLHSGPVRRWGATEGGGQACHGILAVAEQQRWVSLEGVRVGEGEGAGGAGRRVVVVVSSWSSCLWWETGEGDWGR
jgi:hypothetical protein